MIFSLENIINFVILIMLAVMIGYCIVLNKRLKAFRNIKQEMADVINQLNTSTSHAQKSIVEFKNVVFEEEKKLDQKLRKASEMADELDMINQTGSNLADRIEQRLTGNKKEQFADVTQKESLAGVDGIETSSDRVSLSGLDKSVDDPEGLRESLRNVR